MNAAAGVLGPLKKVGTGFGSFSAAQKVIAVIGVAGLLLGGTAFWRWASEPTMTPLFSNLAMTDASAITEQLDSTGTPYELVDGGATILVPQDQVYGLRLDMSTAGLPGDAGTGYALLDEQGVTASQFQQKTTWQRALEGELATTIGSISGVDSARVQLAIPEDDVFADSAGTPTASVLVTSRPGSTLTDAQVQSVLNLVSSSVEGMAPEDVTVVDSAGTLLSASGVGGAAGGMRDQQTADYETRVTGDLQEVLDKIVGKGNAVATVTATLGFDDVTSTEERFTQPEGGPLALTQRTTEETYTGAGGAPVGGQLGGTGILGPDNIAVPNAATQATGADGEAGGYSNTSGDSTFGVDKTTTQTNAAPGGVERQAVSVVVDTAASRAVDMQQLQAAVTAAAGIDAARGDVVSVTQMPFDTSGADAAGEAAAAAAAAEEAEARNTLIATGAVLLVVLLLLVVAVLAGLKRRKRDRRAAQALDLGPMEALVQQAQAAEAAAALPAPRSAPAIERAPKDDAALAREQVAELADRSPDDVAELLRGWLAADKR